MYRIFALASILSIVNTHNLAEPIVETAQGFVLGSIKFASEGRPFIAFQGIPYAKPPVGPLRFKTPEPAEPWDIVFNATVDAPICMQPDALNNPTGSEDCLKLSVYTSKLPNNSSNTSLTVYVYIHGGSFYLNSIQYDYLNPERFMNLDIVVVNIQYRLGALGFLATDDKAASGNFGLLDQNLALNWIQQNIAAFGGNPNDITLAGHSAGAVSVLLHMISPMSAGLFHRGMAASGPLHSNLLWQTNPLQNAKTMAIHCNCSTDNTTELIDCLREVSAENFVYISGLMMPNFLKYPFAPNIETSSHGRFLSESPLELLKSGHFYRVPLLLGFTRDETSFALNVYHHELRAQQSSNFKNTNIISKILKLGDYINRLDNISHAIRNQYYSSGNFSNQVEVNVATIEWTSDMLLVNQVCETVLLISSHNVTTYLYAYSYVSSSGVTNFTGESDVYHGHEQQYLWYRNITDEKDKEFGNKFFKTWTNFAITGKPTQSDDSEPEWLPTTPGEYNYYEIQDNFTMHENYESDRMNFWWNTVPAIVNSIDD